MAKVISSSFHVTSWGKCQKLLFMYFKFGVQNVLGWVWNIWVGSLPVQNAWVQNVLYLYTVNHVLVLFNLLINSPRFCLSNVNSEMVSNSKRYKCNIWKNLERYLNEDTFILVNGLPFCGSPYVPTMTRNEMR